MCCRDVASLTLIEQHRKHKAEVMAIASSAALDANFVVAGDRQGQISAWKRDVYVELYGFYKTVFEVCDWPTRFADGAIVNWLLLRRLQRKSVGVHANLR